MNRVANKTAAKGHPRAILHQLIRRGTFLVLFRGTYWARSWSQLSKEEEKIHMRSNCRVIEGIVMELFF